MAYIVLFRTVFEHLTVVVTHIVAGLPAPVQEARGHVQ